MELNSLRLTKKYTSGRAVAYIPPHDGKGLRIFYLYSQTEEVNGKDKPRQLGFWEFSYDIVNKKLIPFCPPELNGDNRFTLKGKRVQGVNPFLFWIHTKDGRQQLRAMITIEDPEDNSLWPDCFVDLPIFKPGNL